MLRIAKRDIPLRIPIPEQMIRNWNETFDAADAPV
jgi:hypothetical protein